MFNINEELDKLPKQPGVYLMHDKEDNVIYVGKAKNLYNRVRSYFRVINNRTPKIERMISLIDHFEYIVVDSELESLILENNLIKEYNPKYNTLLKDSKTYPYLRVSVNEDFPVITKVRKAGKDKARYFGPFTSESSVKDIISLLNATFCIRTCSKKIVEGSNDDRPCLNYHMGLCNAPCGGKITKADYRISIDNAIDFLNGNDKSLMRMLKEKMQKASDGMEFEEAIKYRELIESAKHIIERQKITDTQTDDRDVIAQAHDETDAVVQVFFIRNGKMIGREHHHMSEIEGMDDAEIMEEFVKRYYTGTPFIPSCIMLSENIEDRENIEAWLSKLRGGKCRLVSPKIGTKEKLVELAAHNARLVLQKDKDRIILEEKHTKGAMEELRELISLDKLTRIEAFDISNTNGFQNVGSMVVFEEGKPVKGDYRKFRIKSVKGPDDYACMHEVLTRRFLHGFEEKKKLEDENLGNEYGSFSRFPDLILMDGGKGQVNICKQVCEELSINIPVCGMVKDDNHRTRGLYLDEVEIEMERNSEAFKLITRVQDEAHRFAIEYHKSLREKNQVKSVLEDIPGVGEKRRKDLMRCFDSIDEIKAATVEEIVKRTDIPVNIAENIYNFFHADFT